MLSILYIGNSLRDESVSSADTPLNRQKGFIDKHKIGSGTPDEDLPLKVKHREGTSISATESQLMVSLRWEMEL